MKASFLPVFLFAALSLAGGWAGAQEGAPAPTPDASADEAENKVKKWVAELPFEKGTIEIGKGLAVANLSSDFKYLNAKDSGKLLELFGNPPQENLGIIFPASADLLAGNSWFVILQYDEDGYVKDDDAEKINYNDLLKDMQKEISDSNPARAKEGYPTMELVRWAAPPHYDRSTHKLYWAKELKFEQEEENTLNYNLRMLGRKGVLILNAVSTISQLPEIEAATPQILSMVDFKEGNRYADFNPATDQIATYGIAALVAGGVAAKAGFFKGLWIALLAGKKFIIMGVIALYALIKKFMGARSTAHQAE